MSKQTIIIKEILEKAGFNIKNAGGTSEQIIILSSKIDNLTIHLKTNKKDLHSTRGLLQMIADRRKLVKYLKRKNMNSWLELAKKLNLKK